MRPAKPATGRRGFTLLEMAIAIALIAMFMTLAAFNMRGIYARQQLDHAAQQVRLHLRELRQRALRERRVYVARIDWKNSRLLWSRENDPDPRRDPEREPEQRWREFEPLYELPKPVVLVRQARPAVESFSGETDPDGAYFFGDGRCTPGLFELRHEKTHESKWIVLTDWSGQVEVRDTP